MLVVKQKIAPVVKVDTVGTDFTGPTFPSTSMENNLSYPIPQPSINTDPITDTIIESFYSGYQSPYFVPLGRMYTFTPFRPQISTLIIYRTYLYFVETRQPVGKV